MSTKLYVQFLLPLALQTLPRITVITFSAPFPLPTSMRLLPKFLLVRFSCHSLQPFQGFSDLTDDFFLYFPHTKFQSLCCKCLWVLANAYCYGSTTPKYIPIIQNNFTTLKFPCAPPLFSLSCPLQPLIFFTVHSFAFCRMSLSWNYIICSLPRLASLT